MATTTLHTAPTGTRSAIAGRPETGVPAANRKRAATAASALASPRTHALFAPLFLFAYGILGWVDSIDGRQAGPLFVLAQLVLLASVVSFAQLAAGLAARLDERVGLTAALTGTAGLVAVVGVHLAGAPPLPSPVAVLAAALTAAGLFWQLARLAVHRAYPWAALGVVALGGLAMAAPLDLLPLGALLVLIGHGPLMQPLDADAASSTDAPRPRREHVPSASR